MKQALRLVIILAAAVAAAFVFSKVGVWEQPHAVEPVTVAPQVGPMIGGVYPSTPGSKQGWISPVRAVAASNIANLAAASVTQDGVTLVASDRVLLVGQSTASQNGVYVVGTVGGGTAPLTRSSDFATSADVVSGSMVQVAEGSTYVGSRWVLTTPGPITLGTTSLTWASGEQLGRDHYQTAYGNPSDTTTWSLPVEAVVGATGRPTTSMNTGLTAHASFHADMSPQAGGFYSTPHPGTQTVYSPFWGMMNARSAGTMQLLGGHINQYGRGNAMTFSSFVNCLGGGEVQAPDSLPLCGAIGESHSYDGHAYGYFYSTIAGSPVLGATTFSYVDTSTDQYAGQRTLLNLSHVYTTGLFQGPSGYQHTFSGSSLLSLCPDGGTCTPSNLYVKTGSAQEHYLPVLADGGACPDGGSCTSCLGDDVYLSNPGRCIGHWYRVTSIDDDTHLTTAFIYDRYGLTQGPGVPYMIAEGVEVLSVDADANTFTAATNSLAWSNGDTIVQGPSYQQRSIGLTIVMHKKSHIVGGRVPADYNSNTSAAISVVSDEQRPTYAMRLAGVGPTTESGFWDGIKFDYFHGKGVGFDTSNVDWDLAAIAVKQSDGTNNKIRLGGVDVVNPRVWSGGSSLYDDGTNMVIDGRKVEFKGGIDPGGSHVKFAESSCGSIAAGTDAPCDVTWATSFPDGAYKAVCSVNDVSYQVEFRGIEVRYANKVTTVVHNRDVSDPHTVSVTCQAMY